VVDRIAGIGSEDDVARRGDCLGEVGKAFLAPKGYDHLTVRIDLNPESALVIGSLRLAEARNALGCRIAVGGRLGRDFSQLLDNVPGRRSVRIAHAKIDDVLAACTCCCLHRIHFGEHIGREAADAVEIVVHDVSMADDAAARQGPSIKDYLS
jgi:hypothetical protein